MNYNLKKNSENYYMFFLDLSVEAINNKFFTEPRNKRYTLLFHANVMPYMDFNTPSKMLYASIGSEILCLSKLLQIILIS